MKFTAATIAWAAAALAGGVFADDAQKVLQDESSTSTVAEEATSTAVVLPTFTVSLFRTPLRLGMSWTHNTNR